MALIKLLEDPEDDTLPPPPPLLRGGSFPIDDLLLEVRAQRQRAKRREAAFVSVIAHLCFIVLLLLSPKIFGPVVVPVTATPEQPPQMTYLEMPKDLIKKPVHPKALSDQDRHFDHPTPITNSISAPVTRPTPKPEASSPAPGPVAPRPPAPQPAPAAPQPTPPPAPQQGLKLEDVPHPNVNAPRLNLGLGAAEQLQSAIEDATREGAAHSPSYGEVTPLAPPGGGQNGNAPGETGEGAQILTDTEGVDFSSYLRQVVEIVRRNWYAVMPETVYLGTKGRVVVIFNINSNGTVPELHPVSLSGTASLDHAAEASISASNPFPPLPPAFHGPFITLQFSFFYNETPQQ